MSLYSYESGRRLHLHAVVIRSAAPSDAHPPSRPIASAALRAHIGWRKRFDDAAFGNRAAATLVDDRAQFTAERPEIRDFPVDLGEMLARDCIDRTAGAVFLVGQAQ